jgi:hypothetical protein
MTGDEIFEQLKENSDRWGANNRPTIYLTTAILERLPVAYIAGKVDRFQLSMTRELDGFETFSISLLNPDEYKKDGYEHNLWWD